MSDISLVKIKTYRYLHEAQIAKTALESEGIQAFIDSEFISTMNWAYSAPDGIGLRVNAEDVEEALEILKVEEPSPKEKANPTKPKTSIKFYVVIIAAILLALWFFIGF